MSGSSTPTPRQRFDFWHVLAAAIYFGAYVVGAAYLIWRIL